MKVCLKEENSEVEKLSNNIEKVIASKSVYNVIKQVARTLLRCNWNLMILECDSFRQNSRRACGKRRIQQSERGGNSSSGNWNSRKCEFNSPWTEIG